MNSRIICVPDPGLSKSSGILPPAKTDPNWVDPFLYPPPEAVFFDRFASVSTAPGATSLLCELQLTAGEQAVITGLGQEIQDDPAGTAITGFSDTIWSLRVNDAPTRDHGNMVDQRGRGFNLADIRIKISEEKALIQFMVTNTHGADTFLCFGVIQGYSFRSQRL